MTPPESQASKDPGPAQAEELFGEFLARREAGEAVSIEDYCRRHPAAAQELRRTHGELLGIFEELEQLGAEWGEAARTEHGSEDPVALGPMSALTTRVLERLSGRRASESRYRVEEELARGGMGRVLRVWDEDLRRLLAMKVILDAPAGNRRRRELRLARFLEEAQITGQLDHPGIVPVHELGIDAQGRVFFTMKLVRGRTLKAVAEEARAGKGAWTRTRMLETVLRICEAMAYAHAKGVIHRDLKPANVMVGRFGEVYVMDWGLARLIGRADTKDLRLRTDEPPASQVLRTDLRATAERKGGSPLYTMDGDVLGTPAYMSPEQARGDGQVIGPAADVYSVGAILYHLLSGSMPYVSTGTRASNRDVWRRVQHGPPDSLAVLAPDVPGELVAICEKAMARDPGERYESMERLAGDLRAFIEGRVVDAYRTGALAELSKWVRRNRGLAAALAGLMLSTVGGLALTSWVQARERAIADRERDRALLAEQSSERERDHALAAGEEAQRAERSAQDEAAKSTAALDFLQRMLASGSPGELGSEARVGDLLDSAAARLEGYEGPAEVASLLRDTLGSTYLRLGRLDAALDQLRASVAIAERHLPRGDPDRLRAQSNLGMALTRAGALEEADGLLRRSLAESREYLGPDHAGSLVLGDNLVVNLLAQSRFGEADELSRGVLADHRRVLGDDRQQTLDAMGNRARAAHAAGAIDEAGRLFRECWERSERVLGPQQPRTLLALINWALFLRRTGRYLEAEPLARRAVEGMSAVLDDVHPDLLVARSSWALILAHLRRYDEAEALFRETLRVQEERLGREHADTIVTLGNLALMLGDSGAHERAEELHWELVERSERALGEEHVHTLGVKQNLGRFLSSTGRAEEGRGILEEVLATKRRVLGEDHPGTLSCWKALGRALILSDSPEQALPMLEACLARMEAVLGPEHGDTLTAGSELAAALAVAGRLDAAEERFARTLADQERVLGADNPETIATREQYRRLLEARERADRGASEQEGR